ncbi:hypothetical protein Vi05172_g2660 [Venturia inaequalis]|nr:hypothetical protein Vi05172_g2660 [Venturia inaequalis]
MLNQYYLDPTPLVPNSPYPLLHYPGFLSAQLTETSPIAPKIHSLFNANGWNTQWIVRYGSTQQSHYHSQSHECMAVLSGTATIRFGAADPLEDMAKSTEGANEEGGIEVEAREGDVFVIPAGVAHKTFNPSPAREFALLTPGEGRGVAVKDGEAVEEVLGKVRLEGFCMMGAYPVGGEWDFVTGCGDADDYESVWRIGKPERDPVLGGSEEGLCGLWKEVDFKDFDKGRKRGGKSFDGLRMELGELNKVKL